MDVYDELGDFLIEGLTKEFKGKKIEELDRKELTLQTMRLIYDFEDTLTKDDNDMSVPNVHIDLSEVVEATKDRLDLIERALSGPIETAMIIDTLLDDRDRLQERCLNIEGAIESMKKVIDRLEADRLEEEDVEDDELIDDDDEIDPEDLEYFDDQDKRKA